MAYEDVEFYPVTSSNVAESGYDYEELVLYVRFMNGALYYYSDVPPEVWDSFLYSESKGRFVHTDLKGIYPYGRMEG